MKLAYSKLKMITALMLAAALFTGTGSEALALAQQPGDTGITMPSASLLTASDLLQTTRLQTSPERLTATTPSLSTLAAQFEVKADKYYNSVRFSSNHYKYTEADIKMLAIVVYREARGQPYKAKVAVANVVMNRVLASGYPGDTISAVVTRANQFAYSASTKPDASCMAVARDVLEHEVWTVPQNTYFFRATSSKSNWGRHTYYAHVGSQAFYRDSGYKGRYNGSTVPASLFKRVYRWPQYGCVPAARVKRIQSMLISFGYELTADGYFGQGTKDALIKFQKSKGLKADGVAGPATLKAMIKKYGVSKFLKL